MTRPRAAPSRRRPSANVAAPSNPLGPTDREAAVGATPFVTPTQLRERGTIIGVDANRHTYRVATNRGPVLNGVARLRASPGDTALLPLQQLVMVDHSLGEPYIVGVLPLQVEQAANETPSNVTGTDGHGGEDPVLNRNFGATARAPGEPRDLLPGDVALRSPDGAVVAALHGKVALLQGSPLAQVRAFGENNALEIIGGLLRVVTWMGEARVINEDGKTSFVWRGGADQLTETGADEDRYTLRLDLGHTGDLVNFEVTTPAGQSLFRFHVDPRGRASIVSRGGWEWTSGSDSQLEHPQRIHGAHVVEVEGSQRTRVAGAATHAYDAGRATTVADNDGRTVGQDAVDRINRDLDVNVGGTASHVAVGDVTRTSSRGSVRDNVTVGNYAARINAGGWSVRCDAGNASVTCDAGKFQVLVGPDSAEFGRNPTSHGTKYEQLATALNALVTQLNTNFALIATHIHNPSTPASPTLVPLANPYVADWSAARSNIVKLD